MGISETVSEAKNLDASKIIKEVVGPMIQGGGGGQKTLATAGGQDVSKNNEIIKLLKNTII